MNRIRQVQELNKRELEAGVSLSASWHNDYRDTAFIYIGGLSLDLSEGDVITIFSQYGEPTFINLVRDKETGKSKGFCFLKYEDQRSTDLAVDNLSGAKVLGRLLSVDHTRYKKRDDEEIFDNTNGGDGRAIADDDEDINERESKTLRNRSPSEEARPLLKEEKELMDLRQNHDEDDPMKEFLISEKQEQVTAAIEEYERNKKRDRGRNHRHHHRSRKHDRKRSEADEKPRARSRSRSPKHDRAGRSDDRHRSHRTER